MLAYGQPCSPECFDDETTLQRPSEPIIEIPTQNEHGERYKYTAQIKYIIKKK